jgi:hypothetical protein
LHLANKKKFPSPKDLRAGALIKVPANVLASNSDSDSGE